MPCIESVSTPPPPCGLPPSIGSDTPSGPRICTESWALSPLSGPPLLTHTSFALLTFMNYRLNYWERDKMLREGKREKKKRKGKGRHMREVRKATCKLLASVSFVAPLKYCVIYHHIRIHVYFAQVLLVQQPLHSSLYFPICIQESIHPGLSCSWN